MNGTARNLMTQDESLVWCLEREARYGLVGGVPVEMIGDSAIQTNGVQREANQRGASHRHDRIVIDLIVLLGGQLRGTPCRPATADIAVRTKRRSIRRPDVTVACDPPRADTDDAETARMVIEVLSPSNRGIAWQRKLEEYHGREGLAYILLVESERPGALLTARVCAAAGITEGVRGRAAALGTSMWDETGYGELSEVIERPAIGVTLPLSEIYADIADDAA